MTKKDLGLKEDEELKGTDELNEPGGADEEISSPADDPAEVGLVDEAVRMTADVPVQVVAVMGKKTLSVKDLVSIKIGQVLDLNRPPNEVVDLVAGGKLIAKGELVEIDGKLGVRIVKMMR